MPLRSIFHSRLDCAKITFVLFLSAAHLSQSNRTGHEGKTALAIKQDLEDYNNPIPLNISDFKELARNSKIFIDNTLFCKELLDWNHRHSIIISPDQWGRTTLLTMLKTFLEIQVNKSGNRTEPIESTTNYRLFKNGEIVHQNGQIEKLTSPLLIADEDETIGKYLGKHPVVYVSFKHVTGKSQGHIVREIAIAVQKAFQQHEYMTTVMRESQYRGIFYHRKDIVTFLEYLQQIVRPGFPWKKILRSLNFLGRMLQKHFGKKSYLLIDDYDTPLLNGLRYHRFPREQESAIFQLFDDFHHFLLEDSTFEKIFEMGTTSIKFEDYYRFHREVIVFETKHANEMRGSSLREYFGFKQSHVGFLFDKCNMTGVLEKAKRWYNGYQSSTSNESYFNSVSIVEFLFHRKFACYRPQESKFSAYLQRKLRRDAERKNKFFDLICSQTPQAIVQQLYCAKSEFFFELTSEIDDIEVSFGVLRAELRITVNYPKIPEPPSRQLPNYEVDLLISKWLLTYYMKKYDMDVDLLRNTGTALRDVIFFNASTKPLQESLLLLHFSMAELTREVLHPIVLVMKWEINFEIIMSKKNAFYIPEMKLAVYTELYHNASTPDVAYKNAESSVQQQKQIFPELQKAQFVFINVQTKELIDVLSKPVVF